MDQIVKNDIPAGQAHRPMLMIRVKHYSDQLTEYIQYQSIFDGLKRKYAKVAEKMSILDRVAFEERLFTMAKREILPYGEHYHKRGEEPRRGSVYFIRAPTYDG